MNDDRFFALPLVGNHLRFGAHINPASTGTIGLNNAGSPVDLSPGRKIRPRDVLHQFVNRDFGVLQRREATRNDFTKVMGRDIRGHPHGNTGRTIDQ